MLLQLILAIEDPVKQSVLLDFFVNYGKKALAEAMAIVHNYHTAEDMVSDAIVILTRNPNYMKYDTAKENWPLYSAIIRNLSKNYMRKYKNIVYIEDYPVDTIDSLTGQEIKDLSELLATKELYEFAQQAISSVLLEIDKDILLLRFENELSYEEISAICGISAKYASTRAIRALAKLNKEMQKKMQGGEYNGS